MKSQPVNINLYMNDLNTYFLVNYFFGKLVLIPIIKKKTKTKKNKKTLSYRSTIQT